MCGIFGYCGSKNDAAEIVLKGLKLLEYRGYDSWGVASLSIDHKKFVVEKHTGKIGAASLLHTVSSGCAIGHTRWATHGGVTEANAHPHVDSKQQVALVHNGIIENYQELRNRLTDLGYRFISQTDSEVGAQLIAEYLKTNTFCDAVRQAFLEIRGLNAWVVMDLHTTQVVAVRQGSPLAIGTDATGMYFASDVSALSEYTDLVYFFEDGDLLEWNGQKATLSDVKKKQRKSIAWQQLDISVQDLSLGNSPHFMIKEILEQPKVLRSIIGSLQPSAQTYAKHMRGELAFVGCGSAYHAALVTSYFLALIAKRRSTAISGSEFELTRALFTRKSFITFMSQSGETIDLLESVNVLKKAGVSFGAIVNRLGSSLERSTKIKILLGAGPEQCVLSTKSFSAKVAVSFLIAHAMVGTLDQGVVELAVTIKEISRILAKHYDSKYIQPLAKKISSARHVFIVGRGVSYPVALEAALKIKEVTYIHTEGFAGGELKHGVIALIEEGTPCILFAPKDDTYASMISTAMEIKSRGAFTIGISDEKNEVFDFCLPLRYTGFSTAITQSIVVQLLAYDLALMLGRDPDKPRNLAKSVTVK